MERFFRSLTLLVFFIQFREELVKCNEKEKIEYANKKNRELTVEMAKSMFDEGIDLVKIMKVTGLTEEELLHLQNKSVTV